MMLEGRCASGERIRTGSLNVQCEQEENLFEMFAPDCCFKTDFNDYEPIL